MKRELEMQRVHMRWQPTPNRREMLAQLVMSGVTIAVLAIILFKLFAPLAYTSYETVTVAKVVDSGKWVVTTKGETIANSDSVLLGKHSSDKIRQKMQVGKTYSMKLAGLRKQFPKMYRNIIEAK